MHRFCCLRADGRLVDTNMSMPANAYSLQPPPAIDGVVMTNLPRDGVPVNLPPADYSDHGDTGRICSMILSSPGVISLLALNMSLAKTQRRNERKEQSASMFYPLAFLCGAAYWREESSISVVNPDPSSSCKSCNPVQSPFFDSMAASHDHGRTGNTGEESRGKASAALFRWQDTGGGFRWIHCRGLVREFLSFRLGCSADCFFPVFPVPPWSALVLHCSRENV